MKLFLYFRQSAIKVINPWAALVLDIPEFSMNFRDIPDKLIPQLQLKKMQSQSILMAAETVIKPFLVQCLAIGFGLHMDDRRCYPHNLRWGRGKENNANYFWRRLCLHKNGRSVLAQGSGSTDLNVEYMLCCHQCGSLC